MSVTEEIKSRLDLVNYVQQYAPLKKAGRYYKACCPFHAEKTPSFVVNPETQTWRCFGACAEGGDLFSFAQKQHGWSFREALEELGRQAGVEVQQQTPAQREQDAVADRLRGIMQTAAEIYHNHLLHSDTEDAAATRAYVAKKRGLTDETVVHFAIGYAPPGWQNILDELKMLGYDEQDIIECGLAVKNDQGRVYDRFRNRLMLPIRDERGRVVGFGARALAADDNPKYLNSPQTLVFDKSRVLYGLDAARRSIRETETAVIVEGYLDVIQAHQAGHKNVVAQMGTAMTEAQLKRIAPRYAKKVVLALDSDAAGQNATRRSLETARQVLQADFGGRLSVDIRVLQIPDAKDPDDLIREDPEQWPELVAAALPVADFVINMEMAELPNQPSVVEREAVAKRVLPLLLASENDFYRSSNLQRLALRLRINEQQLLVWAQEQPKARPPQPSAVVEEGPPPLDYETLDPPDMADEDYFYDPAMGSPLDNRVPLNAALQTPPSSDHTLEAEFLRGLCLFPEAYYQVRRKFREMAANDERLEHGPLSELGAQDFIQADYSRIMAVFLTAVQQHESDIEDFLRENLEHALHPVLEVMLREKRVRLTQQLAGRFAGDLEVVWVQQNRTAPLDAMTVQIMRDALKLRRKRLARELDELRFMMLEHQEVGDFRRAIDFTKQVDMSSKAMQRLDAEVAQQHFS